MLAYDKGQVIVPTGGGKTICMIQDVVENCKYIDNGMTTVVVAPRILLAEQLCSEFLELIDTTHTHVMHVHSGETDHYSTTNADNIHVFTNTARAEGENVIIFTTYHSLHRVMEADIEVNTIYFDKEKIIGHNTDIEGFETSIKKTKYDLLNKEVLFNTLDELYKLDLNYLALAHFGIHNNPYELIINAK